MNQTELISNISFIRPIKIGSDKSMDIDIKETYNLSLTWGVFEDENDTSNKTLQGPLHPHNCTSWVFLTPTRSERIKMALGVLSLTMLG